MTTEMAMTQTNETNEPAAGPPMAGPATPPPPPSMDAGIAFYPSGERVAVMGEPPNQPAPPPAVSAAVEQEMAARVETYRRGGSAEERTG